MARIGITGLSRRGGANNIDTTPGTNLGVTIGPANSYYLTDLTITNSGPNQQLVSFADGPGGTIVETAIVSATTTIKVAYVAPIPFADSVYAFVDSGTQVDVHVGGILGLSEQDISYNG